ncbi:MAG: endonuclease/exonuclease/phosphatase family protein [Candidatus Thorarchaeota archaeon]
MPEVTDELTDPEYIQEYQNLKRGLDETIPPKTTDSNLLIGTWNIKSFGGLTKKWKTGRGDDPKRGVRALKYIAEIVSRFDVVAIQEVKGNLRALRHMLKALGPDWSLMMSDEVKGDKGNYERLAYVFDSRRVKLSGMAGEMVIPTEELKTKKYTLDKQFARTPYAVGFKAGGRTFVLVTLHVIFGKENEVMVEERAQELLTIAQWLADWARDINSWEQNLVTLGDFNIDRAGDHLYDALISSGLDIHEHFYDLPRTIYDTTKRPKDRTFYDQIAWFTGYDGKPALTLRFRKGGNFDFTKYVFDGYGKRQLECRMSDHFPLWAEFELEPLEEEEPMPTVPKKLTEDMKQMKKDNLAKRNRVIAALTELDNAYLKYLTEADEEGLEIEQLADQYLKKYLFSYRLVNDFKKKLSEDTVSQNEPTNIAVELVTATKAELGPDTNVTEKALKEAMRALNKWPFERRYVRD